MLTSRPHRIGFVISPMLTSFILCACSPSLWGQDQPAEIAPAASTAQAAASANPPAGGPAASAAEPFPDLTIPADADAGKLEALLAQAKGLKPRNPHQYQAMQTAIRDASKQLVKLLGKSTDDPKIAKLVQQAELDTISSSLSLMAFVGEDAQQKTLEQVHEFLKSRTELSLQDTQTGVLAATMLELQPNKKPARDTYQLLYDLLENDEREEMQALRLNLKASMGRLDLLGSRFELDAKSLDGRDIRTDDYAGKFVIVDFFASWCQPCLTEAPHLQKQFEKYKAKGLEVIAISLDTEADALDKYLQRAKLPWPVIHDDHEDPMQRLQMKFGVSQLPTVLLLNKEGLVVSLEARGAELERWMQVLFEAPTLADPPSPPPGEPPVETPPEKLESRVEPS